MVMAAARLMGLNLPAAEAATKVYEQAVEAGLGRRGFLGGHQGAAQVGLKSVGYMVP